MPDLVIFKTQAKSGPGTRFICERHYRPEEMRAHGNSKRYVKDGFKQKTGMVAIFVFLLVLFQKTTRLCDKRDSVSSHYF